VYVSSNQENLRLQVQVPKKLIKGQLWGGGRNQPTNRTRAKGATWPLSKQSRGDAGGEEKEGSLGATCKNFIRKVQGPLEQQKEGKKACLTNKVEGLGSKHKARRTGI